MSHRIRVVVEPDRSVVHAAGELDAYAAPELRAALLEIASAEHVVCDLGDADFIDSTALGVVVGGFRRAREAGTGYLVVPPRGTARRILQLTALDQVLPLLDT